MKKENIINYGIPVLSVILVALLGTIFTNLGLNWLNALDKPSNWLKPYIIPLVWTIIYSLFSIYLIYLVKNEKGNKKLITLLIINGVLNVIWCFIFFTLKKILLGQITIILNLIFAILLTKEIYKENKIWGYILLIYPTWLSIATCLNLAIWILN